MGARFQFRMTRGFLCLIASNLFHFPWRSLRIGRWRISLTWRAGNGSRNWLWNSSLTRKLTLFSEFHWVYVLASEDRVLWHFDRKGTYNVKSDYNVARSTQGVHLQASSSRGTGMGTGKLWNKIWQACIPPNIRVFIWRLLKCIIPTKCALAKKVQLPDMECILCNNHVESDDHLFKLCTAIDCFWMANPARAIPRTNHADNLFDWISEVVQISNNMHIDNFLTCLWVIWKERNNLVWNGGCFDLIFLAKWAGNWRIVKV